MGKYYMITCIGQGDTEITIVDQETWDWIFSPWPKTLKGKNSGEDIVPKAVLKKMRKWYEDDSFKPEITIGSYENDRALQAPSVNGEKFYSMKDALKFIKDKKIKIADSHEGYIY